MKIKTRNLNQVSYLTTLGATLLEIEDKYPNNTFSVEANRFQLFMERHIGLIPYRKYCNQRVRLKERARKASGLPARFTGRDEGFRFADVVRVHKSISGV